MRKLSHRGHRFFQTSAAPLFAAALAFALSVLLLGLAEPAPASVAGWQVEWDQAPAAEGPGELLSVDAGRAVYLSDEGQVLVFDAETNTVAEVTGRGTYAEPAIEGDWVVFARYGDPAGAGLFLHQLSIGVTRQIAHGDISGPPQLTGGRILWTGRKEETLTLNLYDIASNTNIPLNAGTFGQSLPLLLNWEWVVWSERQADGTTELAFAYGISSGEKKTLPLLDGRRLCGLIGDQVVVSPGRLGGLALFDLGDGSLSEIPGTAGSAVAYLASDEQTGRLAWTASAREGAYMVVYDLKDGATRRISTPFYWLGPIDVSGDLVLFRGQPREGIYAEAPLVLFAYQLSTESLTHLGQLILPRLSFASDGAHAFWFGIVLQGNRPRLLPYNSMDLLFSPESAVRLFVARPPEGALAPFDDVPSGHPYRTAIATLFERGAVQGYARPGGAVFLPDQPYLRTQYAKVMVETLGLPVSEDLNAPFIDLGEDDPGSLYPHEYIAAAARAGLIMGYPDGAFRPWEPLSRAQLATLVVRATAALRPGLLLAPAQHYTPMLGPIDPTHGPNLGVAQFNGLLNGLVGFDRRWNPWMPASRGEGGQVLWNLLGIDLNAAS